MEDRKASRDVVCPKCRKTVNLHPAKTYSFDFYRVLHVYTCSRCGIHFAIPEKFGVEKVETKS